MARVYLGIGSNLGKRRENCQKALALLEEAGLRVTASSSAVETAPWGVEGQPEFINMAVEAETFLSPRELLMLLKAIEDRMGREADSERWGPRVIDLDILLYDSLVYKEPLLTIPHPRMHEREFVLGPLCEIAPNLIHPVLGQSVKELLRRLRSRI
jgi:2-amino-4-hydroxy-6-hydroxymethyldihydropteridine diphosphokinase